MTRIALSAIFVLTVAVAGAAWASDPVEPAGSVEAPCMSKPNQEALHACLQEVLDSGATITLPTCDDRTGDELTECQTRTTAYQRALAKVSGDPCIGFTDDKLAECKAKTDEAASSGGGSKKGGLSKHEGTKMERMSDDEDDEEGAAPGGASGAGKIEDVKMERMSDEDDEE